MNKFLSISSQFVLTLSLIVSTANAMESDDLDLSYNGPPCAMKPFTNEDLARYPHIRSLNLAGNTVITDEGLTSLTGLTMLNLRGNRQISDTAVRTLTNLVTLHLGDNDKISGTALALLPNLVNIYREDSMSPQDLLEAKREAGGRTEREFNKAFNAPKPPRKMLWEQVSEDEIVDCVIDLIKFQIEGKNEKELPPESKKLSFKIVAEALWGKEIPDSLNNRIIQYIEGLDPKLRKELEEKSKERPCTIF